MSAYGLQTLQGPYPALIAASGAVNTAVQFVLLENRQLDLWKVLLSGLPLYVVSVPASAAMETNAALNTTAAMIAIFFISVSL